MKNNKVINLTFMISFFVIVISISLIISNNNRRKEFKEEFFFVVNKVEVTPALRCYFYNKEGKKLELSSYTFYNNLGIKSGDIIVKKKKSKELVIYRTDSLDGKENIYLILRPD